MTSSVIILLAVLLGCASWALGAGDARASSQPASQPSTQPASGISGPPCTFLLDGKSLMETRRRVLAGDPSLAKAVQQLRRKADKSMKEVLWTVMSKPSAGPTGDKHDYVSYAPFMWLNPDTPDGLPYVYLDGQFNNDVRKYDRYRLIPMCEGVEAMALAYYLTGEEKYGQRAADQIRTWFLDELTKMNPHLRHAQVWRGRNEGSAFGLLETIDLTKVVDAVAILEGSPFWPAKDHERLKEWFAAYLQWLLTSDLGKGESRAKNNHGPLYDTQTADFALFLGKKELAKEIIEAAKAKRIATQIEPDGSQPQELLRTMSCGYSMLSITGMSYLARLGEHAGVDLWNYRTADGRSIRRALDWMVPYATGEKPWEHQQIKKITYAPMVNLLRQAAAAYKEPAYEQAISKLTGVEDAILWADLLYPKANP